MKSRTNDPRQTPLERDIGLFGALMMGLGSILGTGVFAGIGVATGVAGPAVTVAIFLAAIVATANGLSSAQLAANHPVSGGTYEYGYLRLHPSLGFTAGWMFLCAKSASAATAALACSGYLLNLSDQAQNSSLMPPALAIVTLLTVLALSGIRRTKRANNLIVSVTVLALISYILAGTPEALRQGTSKMVPFFAPVIPDTSPLEGLLEACALMFVAYTGYGRIATLAEEVKDPRRTIPRAIILTLLASMILYLGVGLISVAVVGAEQFSTASAKQAASLEIAAEIFGYPVTTILISIAAVTAMLGVLLNLILGLSRVVLAMARRGDLPRLLTGTSFRTGSPRASIVFVAALITALVFIGDIKTTWSFSAFTVLIYYAVTNLAAMRLSPEERLYPRAVPWVGLCSCLLLAFRLDPAIWISGSALILLGLAWHFTVQKIRRF